MSDLEKAKWRTQYGGLFSKNDPFFKFIALSWVFGVAESKSDVRFRKKQNGGPNMVDFFSKMINFQKSSQVYISIVLK